MASTDGNISAALARLDGAVAGVRAQRRLRGRADAELLELFAEALDATVGAAPGPESQLAFRALRLEMALAAGLGEQATERLLDTAWSVTAQYRATLHTLRSGEVLLEHVHVIVASGSVLVTGRPDEARRRAAYEREVLEYAREETANRLRPIARRLAAEHAEATLDERHAEARRQRSVRVVDADRGMADLIAHLPAEEAYAIRDRLNRIALDTANAEAAGAVGAASAEAKGTAEAANAEAAGAAAPAVAARRSRDEIRADALCDLLLERPGATAAIGDRVRAQIQVVVPGEMLGLGARLADRAGPGTLPVGPWPARTTASTGPAVPVSGPAVVTRGTAVAELIGYGPITAGAARALAASAEVWELIAASEAGDVLAVDRYRPTPQMRRVLAARDLHCRAPGCRTPARRCDIDHTVAAAEGGATRTDNLAHLCRAHHVLKHQSAWRVTQEGHGVLRWTSPGGRSYVDKPPSRVRFRRSREPVAPPGRASGGTPGRAPAERTTVPSAERAPEAARVTARERSVR
ncbi:HNH endonuclease signature motif containing protein [Leucobacter luti]|uniref:Uncharacterized protein DUF222 n=1 Tax=Leucobacter luti TaxID=340320 RepID=A0A4Q7TVG8_9MICO|nr:HNH endonuclease signature motif containing protein [Leucobacter luti]MBL3698183.1 HNH endonuclease [Leucobacter luti]RZT64733.1 uncharacterized protein DUF222 [Leucobacter luti]